jgi:hypothetical protein
MFSGATLHVRAISDGTCCERWERAQYSYDVDILKFLLLNAILVKRLFAYEA